MQIRSGQQRQSSIPPQFGITVDPGERNLGWALLRFNGPINFTTLRIDTNYEVVETEHIDLKKTVSGEEGDGSKAHYVKMVRHHFYGPNDSSLFLRTLNSIKNDPTSSTYEYNFYSENQEGIGKFDRETNPYLADQLMSTCLINGALGATMLRHGIEEINFPSKISKWGNSSCPSLKVEPHMTKTQKRTVQNQSKTIRKNFSVYLVMDILERQKNNRILSKLSQMTMDDRAHLCDAITQGMRCMMAQLWMKVEAQMNRGKQPTYTKLPTNTLPDDVKERIYIKLGTINIKQMARVTTPKNTKRKTPKKTIRATSNIRKRKSPG
jgi:hypothetical protein